MAWTDQETISLKAGLTKVRDDRRFWPDEDTFQLAHQILPIPATEVAVVENGKMLLHYRLFSEWPTPYNRPGWYILGGYIPWAANLEETCALHLRKDLQNEYKRAGIGDRINLEAITLGPPIVIGVKKWMPGEHPFGCPISLICVCEMIGGHIVQTNGLKWAEKTIPTDVPHHQKFQDMVFAWLRSTPEQREWLQKLHATMN